MTTPKDRAVQDSDLGSLHALSSLQPPDGMQDRVLKNIAARARYQQLHPVALGFKKYAWELWAGAAIALVATAVVICIVALQARRTANQPQVVNVMTYKIVQAPAPIHAAMTSNPSRKAVRTYRLQKEEPAEAIPHTPPPQPLTSQEHILLTLANTPSLAASVAQSQTIALHGLGANALFELDHEQLKPMRAESKLLQPLSPLPQNLP